MQYVSDILIEVVHGIIKYVGKYWDNVTEYSSEFVNVFIYGVSYN